VLLPLASSLLLLLLLLLVALPPLPPLPAAQSCRVYPGFTDRTTVGLSGLRDRRMFESSASRGCTSGMMWLLASVSMSSGRCFTCAAVRPMLA
jgi:hypothetical protein